MSKFFINRPIVAMVISILTVIVGAITIANLPVSQFPSIAPPEVHDPGKLRRGRRADRRAIGRHADRTADERRRQPELHVLAQCGERPDDHDRRLRRQDPIRIPTRSSRRCARRRRLRNCRRRDELRRDGSKIGHRAADGHRPVFAARHLRRAVPGELRVHQPERSGDPRPRDRQRPGLRRRAVRDAPVGEARSAREARHHGARNRFRHSVAEHREPRRSGRRRADPEGTGVYVFGPCTGSADVARGVRQHYRSRNARRRRRPRERRGARRTRLAGLQRGRPPQRQTQRDYGRLSAPRHQRGTGGGRREEADGRS